MMADKAKFNFGDIINVHGTGDNEFAVAFVVHCSDSNILAIAEQDGFAGILRLVWDEYDATYYMPAGEAVRIETPLLVPAELKQLVTDDGVMEMIPNHAVGMQVMLDVNSIHTCSWAHVDHPGKVWNRPTAIIYSTDGTNITARLPTEFFEIKPNA